MLVAQPLMHRGHRVRRKHRLDPVAVRVDLRICQPASLRIHQLREPAAHKLDSLSSVQWRAACVARRSSMERLRSSVYALRAIVTQLGGSLEIAAVFEDRRVLIDT